MRLPGQGPLGQAADDGAATTLTVITAPSSAGCG
jgi:hypothetical protein